jgi:hypothetical protein
MCFSPTNSGKKTDYHYIDFERSEKSILLDPQNLVIPSEERNL